MPKGMKAVRKAISGENLPFRSGKKTVKGSSPSTVSPLSTVARKK